MTLQLEENIGSKDKKRFKKIKKKNRKKGQHR